MKRAVTVLTVLASFTLLLTAPAAAVEQRDPDDSDSRLDIARVTVEVEDGVGTFLIRTHDRWPARFLRDTQPTSLKLYLDADRDGTAEVIGNFRFVRDALWLVLRGSNGDRYEWVRVTRADRKSAEAVFAVDLPALDGDHLSVWARSRSSIEGDCPSAPCRDRAPNRGAVGVL